MAKNSEGREVSDALLGLLRVTDPDKREDLLISLLGSGIYTTGALDILAAEDGQQAPSAIDRQHQARQAELLAQYQAELKQIRRGDIVSISFLQAKYKDLGLGRRPPGAAAAAVSHDTEPGTTLGKDFQRELAALQLPGGPRGTLYNVAVQKLKQKYRKLEAEAAAAVEGPAPALTAEQVEGLRAEYQSRLGTVKRGNVEEVSKIQQEYRKKGLEV